MAKKISISSTNRSGTKVVTKPLRLSYVHVFEPYAAVAEATPAYSCVLLIPKKDKQTLKAIKEAQEEALEVGKKTQFGGQVPKNWHSTLHDGDEEMDTDNNPAYAGHMYMSIQSKTPPQIVDAYMNPIVDSTEVYSGCFAWVSMNAFPYNTSGNKGVSFGLNNVAKSADGDFLGGRSRAVDDFDMEESEEEEDLI
jgi:hypothetical protein